MADILIIGNGPAAITAAEVLRAEDRKRGITIVSREALPAYSPCFLARYLAGEVPRDALFMRDSDFYEKLEIEFIPEKEATGINTAGKEVILSDGGRLSYKRLLIAAGAKAVVPPIEGIRGRDVYVFKSMEDAEVLRQKAQEASTVVVLGAGYIGLEVAEALAVLKKKVLVVEKEPRVLPRMIDSEMAALLEDYLKRKGIEVLTSETVMKILRDNSNRLKEIVLYSGKSLKADIMVLAAGVKPNIDFLKGSGIRTDRGIVVDSTMKTNIEDIYAVGDIAEIEISGKRKVNPIHLNAVKTGKVAAANLLGIRKTLDAPLENMNMLRFFDIFVFSAGTQTPEVVRKKENGSLWKTYLGEGRLKGVQVIGDVRRSGQYLWQIEREYPFSSLKRLFDHLL